MGLHAFRSDFILLFLPLFVRATSPAPTTAVTSHFKISLQGGQTIVDDESTIQARCKIFCLAADLFKSLNLNLHFHLPSATPS